MKIQLLAGAACAALLMPIAPGFAATSPQAVRFAQQPSDRAPASFYASRHGAPLWLRSGPESNAARELIGVLQRAPLDGFSSGPALAAQANGLLARARSGDVAALANADRLLTTAWVMYVQALQRPPAGMSFADGWSRPRQQSAHEILQRAAAASSLAAHVRTVSNVNPIYAQIRDAAWASGASGDPRVRASLDRVRATPFQDKYVIVDAASARLWMIEDGRIVDSMKVIVGKPSAQTPTLASTIYYATLNPYWHVTPDLVRTIMAPRVLKDGMPYLTERGYQVVSKFGADAQILPPDSIDWKAVAAGEVEVYVRQLPGPANSLGNFKFNLPDGDGIYLHDTPKKELFAQDARNLSHGCVRLEDAQRLARWLLGKDPPAASVPEEHILLPRPVPITISYLDPRSQTQLAGLQ